MLQTLQKLTVSLAPFTTLDAEFADICEAAQSARQVSQAQAWRNLFRREYRPSLVLATAIPSFQQWTGINVRAGGCDGGVQGRQPPLGGKPAHAQHGPARSRSQL